MDSMDDMDIMDEKNIKVLRDMRIVNKQSRAYGSASFFGPLKSAFI